MISVATDMFFGLVCCFFTGWLYFLCMIQGVIQYCTFTKGDLWEITKRMVRIEVAEVEIS